MEKNMPNEVAKPESIPSEVIISGNILPARIVEITSQFEEAETRTALLAYARLYFRQFDPDFSSALSGERDDALDRVEAMTHSNPDVRQAIQDIEFAGLDYQDHLKQSLNI